MQVPTSLLLSCKWWRLLSRGWGKILRGKQAATMGRKWDRFPGVPPALRKPQSSRGAAGGRVLQHEWPEGSRGICVRESGPAAATLVQPHCCQRPHCTGVREGGCPLRKPGQAQQTFLDFAATFWARETRTETGHLHSRPCPSLPQLSQL